MPHRTIAWLSCAAVGSLGGCFQADATRGLPCTDDDACGSLSCEYGVCGGPTRCQAGAGVGDYCYVLTDEAFPVGAAPAALAIADVNSDFVRDIVTADGASRGVSVLLGDGTGAFASHDLGLPELSAAPTSIGLGHLDDAGWADLAVVTDDGRVHAVLVGEGGVLGSVASVASPVARATRPTIADFVQDGAAVRDIAVLGEDGVFVARNVDLASFEPTWRSTAVDNPRDMLTIQDAAGDPAFAYVARSSDDDISSLERKADGTFSPVASIDVGRGPVSFAISDLNSDDYADVLVVSSDGGLWITKGKSANRDEWSPPEQVYDLGWVPDTLDVLDLDDDGDPDVVVSGTTPDGHADVFLLENDGEGRIIYGGSLGMRHASAAALADLDRDGVPEVVITAADDDVVRLARRAKAPPMPGDDDGTGETTDAGAESMSATETGEEGGTSLDEGPFETGIDPTDGGECIYVGSAGAVDLVRCQPLSGYGYHDQLGFALVDENYYDDIVTVVSDGGSTVRLVAFCSQLAYGGGYEDGSPQLCLDLPLPATATGLAGGIFAGGRPAVAVTHDASITIAQRDDFAAWNLETLEPGDATALTDPRLADLDGDFQGELLLAGAEGLWIARIDGELGHTLAFSGAGAHDPRAAYPLAPVKGRGPGLLTADILFALEDLDGAGTSGAVMRMTFDPSGMLDVAPAAIVADPLLLGIREFEVLAASVEGYALMAVVGPTRVPALVYAGPEEPPTVIYNDAFAEVSSLVVANLDLEPIGDDLVFIGSLDGAPRAVHVVVDDLEGVAQHHEIADSVGATSVSQWAVPCGSLGTWTTELLFTTAYGIERIRAQNGCL